MKHLSPVTRRSTGLSATVAAAGVTAALVLAANGATLNTNLVVNGDFETTTSPVAVGASVTGWTGGNFGAASANIPFAYNYSAAYDNRLADAVPPGNIATSSTDYYWSMNGFDENAFQVIDLSTGPSGSLILGGTAEYDIRAFFTGYLSNLERGRLSLQFINASDTMIGSVTNFDAANTFWNQVGGTGAIPTNAAKALITLTRNPASGLSSGPDVYVDNVSFSVVPEPSASLLGLAGTGLLALRRKRR